MTTRLFSGSDDERARRPERSIEDAPPQMRVEFVDIAFSMAEKEADSNSEPTPFDLYLIVVQMLGILSPAELPAVGFRLETQKYLVETEWPRVYDVVLRLWDAFPYPRQQTPYRNSVNGLLAAHGIVWQMTKAGRLERVLPTPIAEQVRATIDELRRPGYKAACELFNAAVDAFNDIPRRDHDAAKNAFDAMESAAKIRLGMPTATFGKVLTHVKQRSLLNEDVQRVLQGLEVLRHNHLGHGMTESFKLSTNEVDFVYVACAAGARLFARF